MKDIQFNTVNTRIRTYEGQLLGEAVYERLLTVSDPSEIYGILEDTPYGDFIYEGLKIQDFEEVLNAEQKRMYDNLYDISPDRLVIDLFSLKYDYQNLKVLVKGVYNKEDLSSLLIPYGSVPLSELKDLVKNRRNQNVPKQMNECIKEVFEYIEAYQAHQSLDIIFDNHYWQHMRSISEAEKREELVTLVNRNIDVFNISTALRSHLLDRHLGFISAVLAEGGTLSTDNILDTIGESLDTFVNYLMDTPYKRLIKESYEEITTQKTLNSIDILKDNFMMERLKELKIVPFGPTAIIGYIYAKETEIKNLRILLVGKINRIPEEILRSRVRDIYV